MRLGLKLYDYRSKREFIKYFDTEYQVQCFLRRKRFNKNISILERVYEYE